jgi:hypothetical protein
LDKEPGVDHHSMIGESGTGLDNSVRFWTGAFDTVGCVDNQRIDIGYQSPLVVGN